MMMKGESEFAVRLSFQLYGWSFGKWEYYGLRGRRDSWLGSHFRLSAFVQYGREIFPMIRLNVSRNVTPTEKILFELHRLFQQSAANAPGAALGTGDRP